MEIFLFLWCLLHILPPLYCDGNCLSSVDLSVQGSCPTVHSCCRKGDDYNSDYYCPCQCNSGCQDYGNCCADSQFLSSPKMPIPNLSCVDLENTFRYGIYVVTSCADSEHPANDLCLANTTQDKDPFLFVPVTSKRTGIIYKNFFCSICNENIEKYEVKIWSLKIYGDEDNQTSAAAKDMNLETLRSVDGAWYLNGRRVFVGFEIPAEIEDKRCLLHAISSCSENWNDTSFHQKCAEYAGIVMNKNGLAYKNPHCAICNFEIAEELMCYVDYTYGHFSYSDVLFSGLWSLDDENAKCTREEVYDTFAKKCRITKCASKQYRISGRKCVPKAKQS